MKRPLRYPLTVFYDASCPMCALEMRVLRERDCHGRLELVDCSAPQFDEEELRAEGITRRKLMRLIHARDACGRWLVGVDCLAAIYAAVGWETGARLSSNRHLRPALERAYPWIARHRQTLSWLQLHRLAGWLLRSVNRGRCECRHVSLPV